MPRLANGVTFSNSGAAAAEQFGIPNGQFSGTYNLLALDPASATLYSIGVNNLIPGSTDNQTQVGNSGNVYFPTDLITQDQAGYSITTGQGATVTILSTDGQVSYTLGAALEHLGAGQQLTDSFLYAIEISNGTVAWNTVTFTVTGQTANIDLTGSTATYAVLEDQHNGSGISLGHGLVDDGTGNLTDGTVHIHATAASGNATSFSVSSAADDWGTLSPVSGDPASGDATYAYSVADATVYANSHAGHGEIAHTDTFTVTTANGTTATITEVIDGNISAPTVVASAAGTSINEGGSTRLNVSATDHDDNATLSYTIAGLPAGATISDSLGHAFSGNSISLTAAQISSGLTFQAGEEGPVDLHVTVTNTEGTAILSTSADINITVNDAPLRGSSGASVSAVEGATAQLTSATFTDGNPGDHSGDFTATIDWGDHTNSPGTVSYQGGGAYSVTGGHSYADEGNYAITVAVIDTGGSAATITGGAIITDAPLSGSSGASVSAVEGATAQLTNATFTDGNPGDHSGDFTATIDWGDHTNSPGTVSFDTGSYSVAGSHAYADEGNYAITVAVAEDDGSVATVSGTATITGGAIITDAPLRGSSGASVSAVEGATAQLTNATFTDGNPGDHAGDFTATIDWGDGRSSLGTVSYQGGSYSVSGDHTYAEEGSYAIGVTVADNRASTATITGSATVADAPLAGSSGATASAVEGASAQLTNATFTDGNPGDHSGDFAAVIDWGDGTNSPGTVSYQGTYSVSGSHSYADEGNYAISVAVADDGTSTTITGSAIIADAPLSGSGGAYVSGVEGAAAQLTNATFSDGNPGDHSGDFTAMVDWGDGHISSGTVSYQGGSYSVAGSHTYSEEGSYAVSVAVADDGTSTAMITGNAKVADAPLSGSSGAYVSGVGGATAQLTNATFTDANSGDHSGDFAATIDWGDGHSSSGTVSYDNGSYSVAGGHTYGATGSYSISVTIADDGGSATGITGSALITDAPFAGSSNATASANEGAVAQLGNATFTGGNLGDHSGDFTAAIDWGDGTSSSGTVSYQNGAYSIAGSHPYADEGNYAISIAVTDDGRSATTITGSATVADTPLSGSTGASASAVEGALAQLANAAFTDGNPGDHSGDFTATVDWGDGHSSSGTVSYQNGTYSIAGNHSYADEGNYAISVAVADDGGSTATITGGAIITDAPLSGSSGADASAVEGTTAQLTNATFTDGNPGDHSGDFTATIDWGDGHSSTGTVNYQSGGSYSVAGSHSYADEGNFAISVAVTDTGGSAATITGSATVTDAPLTGSSGADASAVEDATAQLTNATFSDANLGDHSADFTAMVDWGDGSSSAGTVSYQSGIYSVAGSHSYADEGKYAISVAVADDGGSTATITGSATVGDTVVANSGLFSVVANHTYAGTLSASGDTDGDASFGLDSANGGAQHGTVVITNAATGAFTYTPNAGYIGGDSFSFTATDEASTSHGAESVKITDTPVVSGPDVWVLTNATPVDIPVSWVLNHVTDIEGQALSVTNVTGLPSGASANYDSLGHLTDIAVSSFPQGIAALTYTVSDGTSSTIGAIDVDVIPQPGDAALVDLTALGTVDGVNYGNYDYAYVAVGTGNSTVTDGNGTTFVMSSTGQNTFDPGAGADTFIYQSIGWSQTTVSASNIVTTNTDTIGVGSDLFTAGMDKIDFSQIPGISGITRIAALGPSATSVDANSLEWQAHNGDLWIFANLNGTSQTIHTATEGGNTYYYAGASGGGTASDNNVMEIHLVGVNSLSDTTLSHPDFILTTGSG